MNFILFGSTAIVCDNLIGSVHAAGGKIVVKDRNGLELVTYDTDTDTDTDTDAAETEMFGLYDQFQGLPPRGW